MTVTMSQPVTQPFIQVRGVSKYFGQFCALDAVSLDIELGQKLVICGPSGSGKSTLIRCINQLEHHEAGEIRIDGIVVDGSPLAVLFCTTMLEWCFSNLTCFRI